MIRKYLTDVPTQNVLNYCGVVKAG